MIDILKEISKATILLNEYNFTTEQTSSEWLGLSPVKLEDIETTEKRLNIKLPDDYIKFLNISNGFPETSHVEVAFLPIDKIDYLKVFDEDLIDIYNNFGQLQETATILSESILIGGLDQEQYFLIQPPRGDGKWRYFKFASWIPGEQEFDSLEDYLIYELKFLKEQSEGFEVPKPKTFVDYSLRDHFFNSDWEQVYQIAVGFLKEYKTYPYTGTYVDLLDLLLIVADRVDKFYDLERTIEELRLTNQNVSPSNTIYPYVDNILYKYKSAANSCVRFTGDHVHAFTEQENSVTVQQIELQIEANRKDLLKSKNIDAKIDYELYMLFVGGNKTDFLKLYEANPEPRFFSQHFDAAIVYATIKDSDKAKRAIERYLKATFNYRPFSPFLNETLQPLFDEEFLKELEIKMHGLDDQVS